MTMLQQLAVKWQERQSALGYKGKKAENACYEYFIGATVALQLASHPEAQHVGTCTSLILATHPFPCALVKRWAYASEPEARLATEAPAQMLATA